MAIFPSHESRLVCEWICVCVSLSLSSVRRGIEWPKNRDNLVIHLWKVTRAFLLMQENEKKGEREGDVKKYTTAKQVEPVYCAGHSHWRWGSKWARKAETLHSLHSSHGTGLCGGKNVHVFFFLLPSIVVSVLVRCICFRVHDELLPQNYSSIDNELTRMAHLRFNDNTVEWWRWWIIKWSIEMTRWVRNMKNEEEDKRVRRDRQTDATREQPDRQRNRV